MQHTNPVVYFEIPVSDMNRAVEFYKQVFAFSFAKTTIDHQEMALFPFCANSSGISGALAKGDIYRPTTEGVLIYFRTDSIADTLQQALSAGASLLYPRTPTGEWGFVAEFMDSEGNRIGLHEPAKV